MNSRKEIKLEERGAKKEALISDAVVLREGNIGLILESYQDIFSNFDPRSYSDRSLSDDFLAECRRATKDKEGELELRLLVPKNKRNISDEIKIKKRLKDYFRKHYLDKEKELKKITLQGIGLIALGMILMFFSYTLYSGIFKISELITNLFLVITEPGGWFLFWIGGERLVYKLREKTPSYQFYKKMSNVKIYFYEY